MPVILRFISAGSAQLLVGPASILLVGADEGAVFDAGHVAGVRAGQEAVGPERLVQPGERAAA